MAAKGCGSVLAGPLMYARFWVWLVRLAGLVLAAFVLAGLPLLARVPLLAREHAADPFDLLLRCLDTHAGTPLYLVKGYADRVNLAFPFDTGETIGRVETARGPIGEYVHTVHAPDAGRSAGTPPWTVTTPTPHLKVAPDDLAAAGRGVEAMYAGADREAVRAWGEGLFVRWWGRRAGQVRGPDLVVAPERGTEDEHLWFAWQRLAAGAADPTDLARLPELVRAAYPAEADRDAALAWARTYHARQEAYLRDTRATARWQAAHLPEAALPPPTETTLAWLLYQFVGLTDTSRDAAARRWAGYFPPARQAAVLDWGRRLEHERRAAGEPLPPSTDVVARLCAVERLVGTDAYGERCRRLAPRVVDPPDWAGGYRDLAAAAAHMALWWAYPNDDLFYLLAAGDPLELHVNQWADGRLGGSPNLLLGMNVAAVLVLVFGLSFGLRVWTLGVVPRLLLLGRNPRFRRYRDRQLRPGWVGHLVGYVAVPLAAWGLATLALAEPVRVQVPSPVHLLAGVYASVVLGGTFVLCLTRLVAVVLLRLGYDLDRGWLDEVIGTALAAAALYLFGNDALAVAASAAFAVLPELLLRRRAVAPAVRPSGKVRTTAVLVQANHVLTKPGTGDAPALALFSLDPRVSVERLTALSMEVSSRKSTTPAHPALRTLAGLVTDERYVPHRRRPLPAEVTGGPVVYAADVFVPRAYLAGGVITAAEIPCLATPGTAGTLELLPFDAVGGCRSAVAAVGRGPLVTVTDAAVIAHRRRRAAAGLPPGRLIRLFVPTDDTGGYMGQVDPTPTDSDWRGEVNGLTVLIDTADAPLLRAMEVGFDPRKDQFLFAPPPRPADSLPLAEELPADGLSGVWELVRVGADGVEHPPAAFAPPPVRLVFAGSRVLLTTGEWNMDGDFTPDGANALDIVWAGHAEPVRACYSLRGDTLAVALGLPGAPRPAAAATRPGSPHRVLYLRRAAR